jgi:glutamate synthase (NADPH) large chain
MKTGGVQAQVMNNPAIQPEKYYREVLKVKIPTKGLFGTGMIFLPQYQYEAILCMEVLTKYIREEGLELIEYHDMAVGTPALDALSETCETCLTQVFIKADMKKEVFEQKLVKVRKLAEQHIHKSKLKHRRSFSMGTLAGRLIREAS